MLDSNYHFEMLKRNISVVFSNIFLNLSIFSSWNVKFKLWKIRKSKSGRTSRKFVCFSKSRRPNVFLELLFKVGVNQSEFRLVRLRSPLNCISFESKSYLLSTRRSTMVNRLVKITFITKKLSNYIKIWIIIMSSFLSWLSSFSFVPFYVKNNSE